MAQCSFLATPLALLALTLLPWTYPAPLGNFNSPMQGGYPEQEDLASFLTRHMLNPMEDDEIRAEELASQLLYMRGLLGNPPGIDLLSMLIMGPDDGDRDFDDDTLREILKAIGGVGDSDGPENSLIDIITDVLGDRSPAERPAGDLITMIQDALGGRLPIGNNILQVIMSTIKEQNKDAGQCVAGGMMLGGEGRMLTEAIQPEMGGRMETTTTDANRFLRLLLNTDYEAQQVLVHLVLSHTANPRDLVHMVLGYMLMNHGDDVQASAVSVLSILLSQLHENGASMEQVKELYGQIILTALSPNMTGTGRAHILGLIVESTLASTEYADLAALRQLVNSSLADVTQETLLQMLDNLTHSVLLGRYRDNEPQRSLTLFLINRLEKERTAQSVWEQIDTLLHVSLAHYVGVVDDVLEAMLQWIVTEAMQTIDPAAQTELSRLLIHQALSQRIEEEAQNAFLQTFLSEQKAGDLDRESRRQVLQFLAFHHLDTVKPGLSNNPVVQYFVDRAIDADFAMEDSNIHGNSTFTDMLIYMALRPNPRDLDPDDVVSGVVNYVIDRISEEQLLRAHVNYLVNHDVYEREPSLARLLEAYQEKSSHSVASRNSVIRMLIVQALRDHFRVPSAESEILEFLANRSLHLGADRRMMKVFLARFAIFYGNDSKFSESSNDLLRHLVQSAMHDSNSRDHIMALLLKGIVTETIESNRLHLLRMLLELALPDAHHILKRLHGRMDNMAGLLRQLLERALEQANDVEDDIMIDRDTLALIVLHFLSGGTVDDVDEGTLHRFVGYLMRSRGDWEFEFLKTALLDIILLGSREGSFGRRGDMWKWLPPRPCKIETRDGEVMMESCEGGYECSYQLRDVIINSTFMHVTFCSQPPAYLIFKACEVVVDGKMLPEDMVKGCDEDDQCSIGPLTIPYNGTQAELTFCQSVLTRRQAPKTVLHAACRVEDSESIISQTRCPQGYSCTNGPFSVQLPNGQSAKAYLCQLPGMQERSIVQRLLEELSMGRGGSTCGNTQSGDTKTTSGNTGSGHGDTPVTLPDGVYFRDIDKTYIKYIILHQLIAERDIMKDETNDQSEIVTLRSLLEQAASKEIDLGSEEELKLRHAMLQALWRKGSKAAVVIRTLLRAALDQPTDDRSHLMLSYILDSLMWQAAEARQESIAQVLMFLEDIEEKEQEIVFTFLLRFILEFEDQARSKNAMNFITKLMKMEPDEAEREAGLKYMIYLITKHADKEQRERGLTAVHEVLTQPDSEGDDDSEDSDEEPDEDTDEDDEDEDERSRREEMLMLLLSKHGEERSGVIHETMSRAIALRAQANPREAETTLRILLGAIVALPTEEERRAAMTYAVSFLETVDKEQYKAEMVASMLQFILSLEGEEREPMLRYILQGIMTSEASEEIDMLLTFIIHTMAAHNIKTERDEGLRVLFEVLSAGQFENKTELLTLIRTIEQGGAARARIIREVLHRAREVLKYNEDESGRIFFTLFEAIMSQRSDTERHSALGNVLELIDDIPNEEESGVVFKHLLGFLLRRPDAQRTPAMRYIIRMIMQENDSEERDKLMAFIIYIISNHENEREREAGLRLVFSAISGSGEDQGSSDELQALIQSIAEGDRTRERVIREVLQHARQVLKYDEEESGRIFFTLLDAIISQQSENTRQSALINVLEFIDTIQNEEEQGFVFAHLIKYLLGRSAERIQSLRYIVHIIMQEDDRQEREELMAFIIYVISTHENEREREEGLRLVFAAISEAGGNDGEGGSGGDGGTTNELEALIKAIAENSITRERVIREVLQHAREVLKYDEEESGRIFFTLLEAIISQRSENTRQSALTNVLEFIDTIRNEDEKGFVFAHLIKFLLGRSETQRSPAMRYVIEVIMQENDRDERDKVMAFIIYVISTHENESEREAGLRLVFSAISGAGGIGGNTEELETLIEAIAENSITRERVIREVLQHAREVLKYDEEGSGRIFFTLLQAIISQRSENTRQSALGNVLEFIDTIRNEDEKGFVFAHLIKFLLGRSETQRTPAMRYIIELIMEENDRDERDKVMAFIIYVISTHENESEREAGLRLVFSAISGAGGMGGNTEELEALIEAIAENSITRERVIREVLQHAREVLKYDEEESGRIFYTLLQAIISQRSENTRQSALTNVLEFIDTIRNEDEKGFVFAHLIKFLLRQPDTQRTPAMRYFIELIMEENDRDERDKVMAFIIYVISTHENESEREAGLRLVFSAISGAGGIGGNTEELEALIEAIAENSMTRERVIREVLQHAREVLKYDEEESGRIFYTLLQAIISQRLENTRQSALTSVLEFIDTIRNEDEKGFVFAHLIKFLLGLSDAQRTPAMRYIIEVMMQENDRDERDKVMAFIIYVISTHENESEREAGLRLVFSAISGAGGIGGNTDELEALIEAIAENSIRRERVIREVLQHAREVLKYDEEESGRIFFTLLEAIMSQRTANIRNAGLANVLDFIDTIRDEYEQGFVFAHMLKFVLGRSDAERGPTLRHILSVIMDKADPKEKQQSLAFIISVISTHEIESEREEGLRLVFATLLDDGQGEPLADYSWDDLGEALKERLAIGEGERDRVLRQLFAHAMTQHQEARDRIITFIVTTIMSSPNAEIRREGIATVLSAMNEIEQGPISEHIVRLFILFSIDQERFGLMEEIIEVTVQSIFEIETEYEKLATLTFVVEEVAHYPNQELRRRVLYQILAAISTKGGRGNISDAEISQLMQVILDDRTGGNDIQDKLRDLIGGSQSDNEKTSLLDIIKGNN